MALAQLWFDQRARADSRSVIDDYFRELQAAMTRESELLGRHFDHRGKLGENREALVARFLRSYLPTCHGVSSGFALLTGALSTQQDVVIYDRLTNPVLFPTAAAPLFPPSALEAVVEVKSRLSARDLEATALKTARLKRELRQAFAHHPLPPKRELLTAAFVFRSSRLPAAVLAELRAVERRAHLPVDDRLDLICLLGRGVVVGGALWARSRGGTAFAAAESIAVDSDDGLLLFYTRLLDELAARGMTPPRLMSYLPPETPMGVVSGVG